MTDVIVIIDYGMGNLGSIQNMFKSLGIKSAITKDLDVIQQAGKLVLSGVGAFDNGMKNLTTMNLIPLLQNKVVSQKTPLIGICLGMQLLSRRSEEGSLPGLSWIAADTQKFRFKKTNATLKVPHMGWNTITVKKMDSPLFQNLPDEPRFYFVHSYHLVCDSADTIAASTWHGYEFASAIQQDHILGVQFHPEKSHKFGMQVLKNFAKLSPC
jgi:glutamine amidotransferase